VDMLLKVFLSGQRQDEFAERHEVVARYDAFVEVRVAAADAQSIMRVFSSKTSPTRTPSRWAARSIHRSMSPRHGSPNAASRSRAPPTRRRSGWFLGRTTTSSSSWAR
jgi:hypothetical protein